MSRWYLDTSAAVKLLIEEADSHSLAELLDAEQPELVAGVLLETEIRRAVQRTAGAVSQQDATSLLSKVSLYEMPASLFRSAGLLAGDSLRSLDALHVATAIRLDADSVITYDTRMMESARAVGLPVLGLCS